MYVIGTAGHVDHGKSSLVQALTGIDPDRLREEKERGLTIDLGFAWMPLSNGNEVSIVDVPGHERFVSNMLAGVGGIDLALLVVAADESVMPQTREHLAILDLLNVRRGIAAVTKRDLVDEEWLDLVMTEVYEVMEGTTLRDAPIVPLSSTTGEGLQELTKIIERLLKETPTRDDLGRPRLSIDRAFTMSGFGTVVTGTLIDGSMSVGQDVEILPGRRASRIRSIQSHKKKVDTAQPGTRVAANLIGLSHEDVRRGDVLTTPGWLSPTDAVDVRLRIAEIAGRPVRHNMLVNVHIGSNEVVGRLRLLEGMRAEPGESVWAQLKLDTPVAVVKDDFFVIRSNRTTIGGGAILETHTRRHKRNHQPTIERLVMLESGDAHNVLLRTIEHSEPAEFDDIVTRANMQPDAARSELGKMAEKGSVVLLRSGQTVFTRSGWAALRNKAREFLADYHESHPLRQGAQKEELRRRIGTPPRIFSEALDILRKDGTVVEDGPVVYLSSHARRMTPDQRMTAESYLASLASQPFSPPTDPAPDDEIIALLVDEGLAVRVSDTIVFDAAAYHKMVDAVVDRIEKNGPIAVSDVRDMFCTSRKYALALLEHLDRARVTRRHGDTRTLR